MKNIRRSFSAFMAVCITAVMLPLGAVTTCALSNSIYVGGIRLTEKYYIGDGDGGLTSVGASAENYNVCYENAGEVASLYFKDAKLSKCYKDSVTQTAYGIYSEEAFELSLEGSNFIDATKWDSGKNSVCAIATSDYYNGDIKILSSSKGNITVNLGGSSESFGINCAGKLFVGGEAAVAIKTADSKGVDAQSNGICAQGDVLIGENSSVEICLGATDSMTSQACRSVGLQTDGGYIGICDNANVKLALGSTAQTLSGQSYGIYMPSGNMHGIRVSGKARLDIAVSDARTMLRGISAFGDLVCEGDSALNIDVGSCMQGTPCAAFISRGTVTVKDNAAIKAKSQNSGGAGGNDSMAIYCNKLVAAGGAIDCVSAKATDGSIALFAQKGITASKNAVITAKSGAAQNASCGIYSCGEINATGAAVIGMGGDCASGRSFGICTDSGGDITAVNAFVSGEAGFSGYNGNGSPIGSAGIKAEKMVFDAAVVDAKGGTAKNKATSCGIYATGKLSCINNSIMETQGGEAEGESFGLFATAPLLSQSNLSAHAYSSALNSNPLLKYDDYYRFRCHFENTYPPGYYVASSEREYQRVFEDRYLMIQNGGKRIMEEKLPEAAINEYYENYFTAETFVAQWSVADGSLPIGIAIDENSGKLFGTPKNSGAYIFTMKAQGIEAQDIGYKTYCIIVK